MKTNFFIYTGLCAFLLSFSSCLESGLDDVPTYSDADITAINFEHRWAIPENEKDPWAGEKLQVKTLTTAATFNEGVIECEIKVPVASGAFTETERGKVALSRLNAYVTISPGATIKAVGATPMLGDVGDFSMSDMSYEVVSADGKNRKQWKLVIKRFEK